jgi:hypothetical protein
MEYSKSVFSHSFSPSIAEPKVEFSQDRAAWNNYHKTIIQECSENTFRTKQEQKGFAVEVVHALNQSISSKPFSGKNITIGTILRDSGNDIGWYLCVSPSCDTVPLQHTDKIAERIKPNRLLKFIRLEVTNLESALENATHSKYIFLKNSKNKPVALEALNAINNQPAIDFAIVDNHDRDSIVGGDVSVNFVGEPEKTILTPVLQLREAYAARFQAVASHHVGRIGVDFIPFTSSDPSPIPVSGDITLKGHIENTSDMIVEGEMQLKTGSALEGALNIKSELTAESEDGGSVQINITGSLAVSSEVEKRDDMVINSTLEVSGKRN